MKRSIELITVIVILLALCTGCGSGSARAFKEDGAGTGYGVIQRSVLQQKDLFFLTRKMARGAVEAQLGSPHSVLLTDRNVVTYRLADGATLLINYDSANTLSRATYTDARGDVSDFFDQLVAWGVRKGNGGSAAPDRQEPTPGEVTPGEQIPVEPSPTPVAPAQTGETASTWFSDRLYEPEAAKEILKPGATRDTVLSALGKPNGYTSISFERDSYLIDVYVLNDGSTLRADYGYQRRTLRAVRRIEGSYVSDFAGAWGKEEKPAGFMRITRNINAIPTLFKNATPAAVYARLGEPDWLEGDEAHYRDAYQLNGGAVLYLDFGAAHNRLASGTVRAMDGKETVFSVK